LNSPGRYLVPLVVGLCFVGLLVKVHDILLPFVLGATLAYLLCPLVRLIEVHGLRRAPAVFLVFAAVLVGCSLLAYSAFAHIGQEAGRAGAELPRYVERGQKFLQEIKQWGRPGAGGPFAFVSHLLKLPEAGSYVTSRWRTWPSLLLENSALLASHVLPLIELLGLVPLIAFLVMLEGPEFLESLLSIVPAPYVEMTLNVFFEMDNSLGKYARGLCVKCFLVSLLSWICFRIVGLDYAMQLSLLAGLANVIPVVGPLATTVLSVGVAVFQWGTVAGVLKILAIAAFLRAADDGVLQMVVFKSSVELHPILLLFSLMAGGYLWGIWGMFFAVPLACIAKVLLQVIWQWYRSEYGLRYDAVPAEASHIPFV